jgi:hypothetical protein
MDDGPSMRAGKDSPVTRLFRNHLRTSEREASKIRTSEGANLTVPSTLESGHLGEIPRRVIRIENQHSASNADQSNYS